MQTIAGCSPGDSVVPHGEGRHLYALASRTGYGPFLHRDSIRSHAKTGHGLKSRGPSNEMGDQRLDIVIPKARGLGAYRNDLVMGIIGNLHLASHVLK